MNWLAIVSTALGLVVGAVATLVAITVLDWYYVRRRTTIRRETTSTEEWLGARKSQLQESHDYDRLDEYWRPETSPSQRSLIYKLEQIEAEAGQVLNERLGSRDRQVFELRAELSRLGIWSDSDIEVFDRAMAVRNAVVHGSEMPSRISRSVNIKELDELLAKLQSRLRIA